MAHRYKDLRQKGGRDFDRLLEEQEKNRNQRQRVMRQLKNIQAELEKQATTELKEVPRRGKHKLTEAEREDKRAKQQEMVVSIREKLLLRKKRKEKELKEYFTLK